MYFKMQNIYGCVFGGAYGDAIGKATEFLSIDQIQKSYPMKKISFSDIIQDGHRDGWDKTDWTDDTDQSILIMETVSESGVQECEFLFAKKLYNWVFNGFPDLGDTTGVGIGLPVCWVLKTQNFKISPHKVSEEVWRCSDGMLYEDGAIMRCGVIGCFDKQRSELFEYTKKLCQVTHYDPRCVASCIFIVSCVYDFVRGEKDVEKVLTDATNNGVNAIRQIDYIKDVMYTKEEYIQKFLKYVSRGMSIVSLSEIDFNKGHSRSNTKYPLYCAIYAIKKVAMGSLYETTIQDIIRQGGDADTNACVAGNLMGSFLGFCRLPKEVYNMKHFFWLKEKIEKNILQH
jgi:ADP-ribosylglycohydrolase